MRKQIIPFLICLLVPLNGLCFAADRNDGKDKKAKKDTLEFSNEYLDTVNIAKKSKINDYSLLGVDYGVTMSGFTFNPTKSGARKMFMPNYFALMYTHYEKLFERYANFAFRTGLVYGHEGFAFEKDEETGQYSADVDGATEAVITMLEMPFMAGFHFDVAPVKFQAEIGVYAGYRKSVERDGPTIGEVFKTSFHDYEYRFDYGFKGGAGIAFMIDPIEIHFNALLRWGWQNLYAPDYYSPYYYRFAYPLDITFTAGIHFQLTKRSGKTTKMLKKEAKEQVYGKAENK